MIVEQAQTDSETILDILGNDTRRRMLSVLSQEPMYFNQLAKEIGVGQQAILRHLGTLEQGGIVETYPERSDLGAPDRKYYRVDTSFVLNVSLSEDDFTISKQKMVQSRRKESEKYYKRLDSMPKDPGGVLSSLQEYLPLIEQEITEAESRLNDLRALKQLILNKLHKIGMETFEENERKILYRIVGESPKSLSELSDILGEKESSVKSRIAQMRNKVDKENAHLLFGDFKS